ncbi:S8 family serine peptidase [Candidatus Lokiarchaeum ossiferum]
MEKEKSKRILRRTHNGGEWIMKALSKKKPMNIIIIFVMILFSTPIFDLTEALDYSTNKNIELSEEIITPVTQIQSQSILEDNSVYDNESHRYVFLFDSMESNMNDILSNFSNCGGILMEGPWENIVGFAGQINNSEGNLKLFTSQTPNMTVVEDSMIQTQMNTVHDQLNIYPATVGDNMIFNGTSNGSIAFLDTGIDDAFIGFENGFGDLNFSRSIIGWKDFSEENETEPIDSNGHGTSIASIAVGSANKSFEMNHSGDGYYISVGGRFNHFDLFYPHHIIPQDYSLKLASFEMDSEALDNLEIKGKMSNIIDLSKYNLKFYKDGQLINTSASNSLDVSWDTSGPFDESKKVGLFDIYIVYSVELGKNPQFDLQLNITFTPENYEKGFANFAGIAPETKITSLKVLNSTGLGYSSDLLSALEWVWHNNTKYRIFVTVLSVGNFDMDELLAQKISSLIDNVIDNGTMVIIAAGNNGINSNMNMLAKNQKAIVVGATNDQDQITYYSSQGENLDGQGKFWYDSDDVAKPDIVAPGGSYLQNSAMILAADTNDGEDNGQITEEILNDISPICGTSVSAGIVAGIYSNIVELFGMWQNGNSTAGYDALRAKALLLMTASETNLQREDDPSTSYDESLESPEINRGTADLNEGYGRVNPSAIGDLFTRSYPINDTIGISLTSSSDDPQATHVYAINITLEQYKLYRFELNIEGGFFADLDADLYLYDSLGDQYGRPVILAAEPQTGGIDEYFYYSNLHETSTYYLIAKAISGEGTAELNVTEQLYSNTTILQNANYTIESSYEYQDILDSYYFEVNYTNAENYPASELYIHFNNSMGPVPMIKRIASDRNYTNGCLYYALLDFPQSGSFSYNFTSIIGEYQTDYVDPDENVIFINPIHNQADYGYTTDFDHEDKLWDLDNEQKNIIFQDMTTPSVAGWNHISVSDTLEFRNVSESENSWKALYCGYSHLEGFNGSVFEIDQKPIYYTGNTSETYELTSPIVFLNESESINPTLKIGFRLSLGELDDFSIEIRINRTGWEQLDYFSDIESDWIYREYDLSEHMNNYTQIRFLTHWENKNEVYGGGVMLDHFTIEDISGINMYSPILSPVHDLSQPNVDQPFFESNTETKFGTYTFQVAYSDLDGDMPLWVNLEIDENIYNMTNKYGRYNPKKMNSMDIRNEIVFVCVISVYLMHNTSFRFIAFDGKYEKSTAWQSELQFKEATAENFPITTEIKPELWTIIEANSPNTPSLWVKSNSSWHQPTIFENKKVQGSWYCGEGNYLGYGHNITANLISPLIKLEGTNEIFLNFEHRLRFETDGEEYGDYAEVFISVDVGKSWKRLHTYDEDTKGTGIEKVSIDISDFMGSEAIFRFKFTSDDIGTQIANSGWKISNLVIDMNHTKDYLPPTIQFIGLESGDEISGEISIEILILDDSSIDNSRTEFWINNNLYEVDIIDNKIIYSLDTTEFENGEKIEIICVVVDIQGNREVEKIVVEVHNPISTLGIVMISAGIALIGIMVGAKILHERKIKKKLLAGEIIKSLSMIERYNQRKFEKNQNFQEAEIISSQTDPNWEKDQPYKLYCKKCKKYYLAPDFEIFCPSCKKDNLFIAKFCPACKKWSYFDEESTGHKCKSCELLLLKDFSKAKQEIISSREHDNQITDSFEKEEELIEDIANKIPTKQFKEITEKIISKKEDNSNNGRV